MAGCVRVSVCEMYFAEQKKKKKLKILIKDIFNI